MSKINEVSGMQKLQEKKPKICCGEKLDYSDSKCNTIDYKAVRATCKKCGMIWEQNLSTNAVYYCKDEGTFIHFNCGEEVDCVWVYHSMWDKRMTCAGDGSVDKYPVPFCPKHEEKPSDRGMPIYY